MNISLYVDRKTWIHRLDARTKTLVVLAFFVLALLYTDPRYLLTLLIFVILGVGKAQSLQNLSKMWILLLLLFVYSAILWPFFVQGPTTVFQWQSLVLTVEGLTFGVAMGLRLDVMVISGVLLLSTTTLEDFSEALQRFGLPSSMGFAFSLAFRWVPTLLGAGRLIIQAQRSRGFDVSKGTFLHKIRGYAPLVVPLIGHTLRQTTLLAMALESKGFSPGRRRHAFRQSCMRWQDYGVLSGIGFLVMISGWLRWNGLGV